ncbi:hypothetical protein RI129_011296 [Pyrocoelia pectoralis]|uniref:C2H2-type domain-containing protein n=1 Tax=Pyrocoelia pectoralis TaxID=417401 RepID=A0AAN7V0S0_9COLE
MANRRFGGAPPQKLGGFAQQNFQGNKMSPWQGGAAPSNAGNSGLLSQLSTPQQLALALTNLLQNQPPQNNNPPSLLSLPTTPGYNNQDSFGSDNRFSRGRDFRRPDPYSKNRTGGWRDNSTRPTGTFGSGGGGGRSSSGRSNSRSNFGSKDRKSPLRGGKGKNDGKNQAGKGKAAKANDSSKIQQKDGDISNDTIRDEENDKQTEDDENKEQVGDDSATGDCIDLSEEREGGADDKKEKKPREGRYHGVPPNLLHCFVCNKSMWDGESFQNHIRGKAHKQMMDSLGQSFQITVNILRENMRLVEEKKMIELERMNRNSRNFHRHQQEQTSHSHRKTEGHQRLKRFLHPKCHYCTQEFPSRMEWVDHRFTPDHLRKIKEYLDARTGEEEGAPLEEQQETEMDNDPLLDESLQTEDENPILELTDDLKDLHNRIPAYKPSRPISTSSVQPLSGFYCDICIRFMTTEIAAKDHLKTERHYQAFLDAAKRQYKRMTDEEKEKEENKKRRKAEEEAEGAEDVKKLKTDDTNGDEMYDPEEACQDNDTSENVALDEEFAEVDRLIKTVSEDEKNNSNVKEEPVVEEEEEDKKPPGTPSNRGRRGGGAVRNGAGPRSKTRRGGK